MILSKVNLLRTLFFFCCLLSFKALILLLTKGGSCECSSGDDSQFKNSRVFYKIDIGSDFRKRKKKKIY
jgi:hypothetical protein